MTVVTRKDGESGRYGTQKVIMHVVHYSIKSILRGSEADGTTRRNKNRAGEVSGAGISARAMATEINNNVINQSGPKYISITQDYNQSNLLGSVALQQQRSFMSVLQTNCTVGQEEHN